MEKAIASAVHLKNMASWAVIAAGCLLALGKFVNLHLKPAEKGEKIFLPGAAVLYTASAFLSAYSVTRVMGRAKAFKRSRE